LYIFQDHVTIIIRVAVMSVSPSVSLPRYGKATHPRADTMFAVLSHYNL